MRRHVRIRRTLLGVAAICALATLTAWAAVWAISLNRAWSPLVPVEVNKSFPLGTAGRPFAWSTAVGNLNDDGLPDYAVADRIGHSAAGFAYSVRFAVSGLAARSVTFDSPESALSISLRDVDHDQDLDVVVSTLISPTVVRVWLNDGRGVFAETSRRDLVPEWRAGPAVDEGAGVSVAALGVPPRRGSDALGVAQLVATHLQALSSLTISGPERVFPPPAGPRRSRAPPSLRLLLL